MRKEYGLKKTKLKPNPYATKLKKSITIRLDTEVVDYFKKLGEETNIPYQTLVNDFLRSCKENGIKPKTVWKKAA